MTEPLLTDTTITVSNIKPATSIGIDTRYNIRFLANNVYTGRRHFPQVNNVPSTSVYYRNIRRYIPHGYCDDYTNWLWSNSSSYTYTDTGVYEDGFDCEKNSAAIFSTISAPSWSVAHKFPGRRHRIERSSFWLLHPDGPGKLFEPTSSSSSSSSSSVSAAATWYLPAASMTSSQYLPDKRNYIPLATPGDKCYRLAVYAPDFYKDGVTVPLVNFGRLSKKTPSADILPVVMSAGTGSKSENYATKERRRRVQEDVSDVTALENWRPASPLTNQLTLPTSHDHPTATSRRHVTDRK